MISIKSPNIEWIVCVCMHIDVYICMCILDKQSYRPCGRHRWESDAAEMHHALESPTVRPTNAHASRPKCSFSSIFSKRCHCPCNGLVFSQTCYDFFERTHTQFLSLHLGEEAFVCLISALYSLLKGIAKHTQQKNAIEMFKKKETLVTKFPFKDYSEG